MLVGSDTATRFAHPGTSRSVRVELRYLQEHPEEPWLAFPQRGADSDSDSSESEPEQEGGRSGPRSNQVKRWAEECWPPGPCTASSYDANMSAWADIRGPCPAVPEPTPSLENTCGTKYHAFCGKILQEIPIVFNAEGIVEMESREGTDCPPCNDQERCEAYEESPDVCDCDRESCDECDDEGELGIVYNGKRGYRCVDPEVAMGGGRHLTRRGEIERGDRRGSVKRATEGSTR